MNYNNKIFQAIHNSPNGEIDVETRFHYQQEGNILTCSYKSNEILSGHLIGLVDEDGGIDMRYHQVNSKGELMTGTCRSTPRHENGKLYLDEKWQWTSGDASQGQSTLEEVTYVDQREKLDSNPFSYKITKDNKIIIYRGNKQIKIVGGKAGTTFAQLIRNADEKSIQMALAKLTGHYKHGNERRNT